MTTSKLGIGVVLAVALAPALGWGQDHVFVGSWSPSGANPGAINVYRPNAVTDAVVPDPAFGVNNGIKRPLHAFTNANGTFAIALMGHDTKPIQGLTYDSGSGLFTAETFTAAPKAAWAMALNREKTIAYLGVEGTVRGVDMSFRSIYKLDLTGLPNSLPAPTLVASFNSDCYDLDVHPISGHIVAACYGDYVTNPNPATHIDELIDINPNGTTTTYPLDTWYRGGSIRIEPTQGNFAYLTGTRDLTATVNELKILSISFASNGTISFNGHIATPQLGPNSNANAVMFHPSGKWAYFPLSGQAIAVLDTALGGQPATSVNTTKTFNLPIPTGPIYQAIATVGNFYVAVYSSSLNSHALHVLDISSTDGTLSSGSAALPFAVASGTVLLTGIARIEEAQSLIIAKVDPAVGPPVAVSLNNLPAAQSTSQVVPGGTSLPIDAGSQLQPPNAPTTGPQYSFLGWTKNAPCGSPFWPLAPNTDPVPQGQTDIYCACYEKQWFVSLNVLGSCSATALNGIPVSNGGGIWIKDGTTVTGSGTGGTVTVTPATGVVADGPLKSITVKCDPILGPCSPASSRPSLVGWWAFEGTAPMHDDRRGVDNYLDPGTSTRGAGYVNQAAFFTTVPINSNASARTTDAAAEVNFSGEAFTIDAWIKYQPTPTGFRSIVDKYGGPDAGGGYSFFVNNGNLVLSITPANQSSSSARSWATTGVNVSNDVWRHVAVVVSRTAVPVFYVDGLPVTSSTSPAMFPSTVDLRSPAQLNVGGFNFAGSVTNGGIDELEIFNEALPAAVIKEIADAKTTGKCLVDNNGCVPPPAGMTGWYTFDEVAGPTANDRAGTNVTATWKNTPTATTGRVAGGIGLGGAKHLEVNSTTEYNAGTGDLSIDAWVNWNGASGVQTILDKRQLVAGNNQRIRGYLFFIQDGQLGFQLADASANGTTCSSTNTASTCTNWVVPFTSTLVPANSWTHVAVTVRRNATGTTAGTFYVNGVAVSGFAAAIRPGDLNNTQPMWIGRNAINEGGFAGSIDELEIFIGRVVPAAEIYSIFNAGAAGKCKGCVPISTTSWVGWWRFEEPDTQFTATDQLGSVNNFIGPVSRVPGKFGKAMRAISVGGATTADGAPELNAGTGDLTIDAWIWLDPSVNPVRPIFSKKFDEGYALMLENGALRLDLQGPSGGNQTWRTVATVPNSQWVFVAARLTRGNPGAVELFINSGTPQALAVTGTIPMGSLDNAIPLRVGATPPPPFGDARVLGGNIDEIEIFRRALSNTEINDIATRPDGKCDANLNPCIQPPSGMQSWHRFEEATGPFLNTVATGGTATVVGTVTRGTGKVGNAVGFTNHLAGSLEVNPATTVAFGNRVMSIDFWIKAVPISNSGVRPVVDKMTGVGSTPNTGYKVDLVNNKVVFTLSSAGNAAVWTSTSDAATGNWVHVAVTSNGIAVPVIYINGVPDTLQTPIAVMITGSINNTAPLRIGSTNMIIPASATLQTQFELDELELFDAVVSRSFVEALAVSTVGKCVPAGGVFPVTVNTNLNPLQGVTVGITSIGSGTDTYSNPSVPSGNQLVFAPATKIDSSNANIQWTLINWSFNGVPNTSWTNATQTVPVSSPGGTYTANYQAWYKLNVVVDGGCVSNLATGFYPFPNPLVISVSGGGVPIISYQGPTLTGGTAPPIDTVANNTALPINFPGGTVTIVCGALVPVTVNTSPANIGATVGILTVGAATNVYTNPNVPNGSANISTTTPMTNSNQDTEWRFKNWSINNVVQPSLITASPQPVVIPNTAVTYTANYDTWFKLTVNITGPCVVSNQTGFFLSGTSFNFGVFATGGGTINSITAVRPNNLSTNLPINSGNNSSNSTINMTSPLTINVVCSGPAINVTVNTNPANLGVTVGIAGGTTLNVHNATLPPSSAQTVTNTPTSVVANSTFYTFANWSPSGPSVTLPATGSATYTANYNLAGYVVTATGCGVALSGAVPLQSNPLVYASGTSLTVTANPATGQSFANFQISVGGNSSTVTTNPTTISVSGPVTVTATCNTSTTTTGGFDSNPSGFLMRVGSTGDFQPTPFTRTVTLNQALTVAAQTPQVRTGTGYEFVSWSNGASTATTTFTPTTTPVNMTANYRIACHVVTAVVSPANGGTISASARSLTGFPDGCYAPGARVTFTVSPAAGQVVTRWTGVEATGNSAVVTVSGPLTITAFTGPVPTPSLAFEYVSRSGLSITLRARNSGTGTATAARLTGVTGVSTGVSYSSPALPVTLGDIPAGGSVNVTLAFAAAAATQGFSFTAQGSAENQGAFSNVITVPLLAAPALQLNAISRTNGTNTITLVFEIRNIGTATATNIQAFLSLQAPVGNLQLDAANQSVADLAAGAARTVTYTVILPPQANPAAGTFNGQLVVASNAPTVSRTWAFQAPTTITPL